MQYLSILYRTHQHYAGLIARATLALVMLPHGCQLAFGLFGGYGFSGSMNYFTQVEGLPWIIGFLVIILQSAGSLSLAAGFMGRLVASAMLLLFTGMIITSHLHFGFFINWSGQQQGEGFEFHLLAMGLSAVVMISGSGKHSVDAWLTSKTAKRYPVLTPEFTIGV